MTRWRWRPIASRAWWGPSGRSASVETIRLATRVPVTLPMRITDELLQALRPFHPLWVMTHFNHPKELTESAFAACARLADSGFPVMNQTVLLAGINDDEAVLEALFRGLVRARVRPYYLLQADPVRGTAHLRTPLARGVAIIERLQGRLWGSPCQSSSATRPAASARCPSAPRSSSRAAQAAPPSALFAVRRSTTSTRSQRRQQLWPRQARPPRAVPPPRNPARCPAFAPISREAARRRGRCRREGCLSTTIAD